MICSTVFKTTMHGLVFHANARAFNAKATSSRPRPDSPKAKKFSLKAKD